MPVAIKSNNREQTGVMALAETAALLPRVLPSVIASEAEYDQTLAEIQRLLGKGEARLLAEEERLLDLLSTLAENWEEAHHPIPEAPSHRILQHYLEVRGVKLTELQPVFGSRAATAAAINGKRAITPEQARQLGALFGVAPAVFS